MRCILLFLVLLIPMFCNSQNANQKANFYDSIPADIKLKIQLEEGYRKELRETISKEFNIFESITKIAQSIAVVVGIFVAVFQLKKQFKEQKEIAQIRLEQTAKEYRKYFFEKQFEFYSEAAEATATLATEPKGSEDYLKARANFFRLFWGRLSIVEEKSVEESMIEFKKLLQDYESPYSRVSQAQIEQASLCLAHEASWYTINVWLDKQEIKNYSDRRCLKKRI